MKNMKTKPDTFEHVLLRSFSLAMAIVVGVFFVFSPNVAGAYSGPFSLLSYTQSRDFARRLPLSGGQRDAQKKNVIVYATSYNSEVGQTDDSPFISANGTYVYDGMIAANFLPFGTLVRIPEYSGDKIYRVDDRMNKRYGRGRIDIWMENKQDSIDFGVQRLELEVLGRQYTSVH